MAALTPLRLSTFNCRSVKSSVDEVKQLCDISSLVMLQEHWLLPHEMTMLSVIHPEFLAVAKSSADVSSDILRGRPYGGTAILYCKDLAANIVPIPSSVGFVELCAKILQIMRNDFKDYARTFCQLFLTLFAKNIFRFCITHSRIQDRPILCLCYRQNSLPPSSKTSDFLYCLARLAALTLAES